VYAAPEYLLWARRTYGQVPFDLATSGTRPVSHAELGRPESLDDPCGDMHLRAAIASYNDAHVDEVIPTLGTTHAVWLAYTALLSPGDEVLVEQPSYEPLWNLVHAVGASLARFERPAETGYVLDPDRVAAAFTPRTRLVVVSNLHNPSGVRATDDALRAIAQFAEARGAYLLVDEVYAPFDQLVEKDAVWRGTARKIGQNVLAVSSLTKCFGVGRDRIGWLMGPPSVIARASEAIIATCGDLPLVHANFAAHVFRRICWLAERSRSLLRGQRETVQDWVRTQPELRWSEPTSGLFGFATHTRIDDVTPMVERAAKEHGVLVAPGRFFGAANGFRLSWSAPHDKLTQGLEYLGAALRSP
jgi:aspartate/methionine/tyrosine aminotransferase